MERVLRTCLRVLGWVGFGLGVLFAVIAIDLFEDFANGDVASYIFVLATVIIAVGMGFGGFALLAGANAGQRERNRHSDLLRALGLMMLAIAYVLGEDALGTARYLADIGPMEDVSRLLVVSLKGVGVIVLSCLGLVLLITGRTPWRRLEAHQS